MLAENIALYIGAPIEEESERMVLDSILATLCKSDVSAVILANMQIGGRQLDFVVGTDQLTLIIEAKASALPLRGQYNGDWEARTRLGRWKPFRNAYLQALQAKHALRDAMRIYDGSLSGYPNACVVFAPNLPPGSDLPLSDYKVSLCDINGLAEQIGQGSALNWSLANWHRFSTANNLQRISEIECAFDVRLLDAQRTLDRYSSAFTATYAPLIKHYVPDTYIMEGQNCTLQDVEAALVKNRSNLLIRGPSGCGKSLLSLSIANRLPEIGVTPLILECKSFDGQLSTSLDREAALLDMHSAASLIAAARRLSRPIAVIVDGYNECPEAGKVQLTRALRAASARYNAMVLITSQTDIERPDIFPLLQVGVGRPTNELKAKIAKVDVSLVPLLETVSTGIEADLVGQVGREIPLSSSRFALFDFFVRRRLGEIATDGIRLLCAIAEQLMHRVTFSLSVREVDRIQVESNLPTFVFMRTQRSGILTVRGDRVSFCHEMYQSAFAAEAIIRKAGSDSDAILAALSVPRYGSLRTFLIGAIDDESLQVTVLRAVSDNNLLEACITGECGSTARRIVTTELTALPKRLEEEVSNLRFKIVADDWWNIEVASESLTTWSEHDNALLYVLAAELTEGRLIKEMLNAVKRMDAILVDEFRRLRPEAVEKRISIRSSLFAVAYMFGQAKIGFTRTISVLHSGTLGFRRTQSSNLPAALQLLWQEVSSSGSLYLALALSRIVYETRVNFAQYALPFLQLEHWKFLPYHVQLDLLDFAHSLHEIPEYLRDGLIDALQTLLPNLHPFMVETAFEVLSGLGILQEEEDLHVAEVRQQIQAILESSIPESAATMAWRLYSAQFDHPFSGAYVQAIDELPVEQRLSLFRLACFGGHDDHFFLSTVFAEFVKARDRDAGSSILRWTALPALQSSMPQKSIETFITAFVALGQLDIELPVEVCRFGRDAREDALLACGLLYYWVQRRDINSVLDEPQAASAMDVLLRPNQAISTGVLWEISHSMFDFNGGSTTLVRAFPQQALKICRTAIKNPGFQTCYFDRQSFTNQSEILGFAIDIVGMHGSADDLATLRLLTGDPKLADKALAAVKAIEGRNISAGDSV